MSTAISITALVVLALCLLYVAMLGFSEMKLALQAGKIGDSEKKLLQSRIDQLVDPVLGIQQKGVENAWSGKRKFILQGKVLEAEDICSFYFVPHDKKPLPPFLPGQYLTFHLNIPGQNKPVVRCYSLSDSPSHPDYYRITVKKVRAPRDAENVPDGLSSSFLHNQLQADDIVDCGAPGGHFYLDSEHQSPVVLIGGGIGLTPALSMLNYITSSGSNRETWFFYGLRCGDEHVQREYLQEIAREHDNVHMHICYSNPNPEDKEGEDYDHAERVSVDLFKRLLPSNNYDYYICGPAPMMESVTNGLEEWGVPSSKIHFEAFGPATVKKVTHTPTTNSTGVEITFARSDKTLEWDGSASLLEFAEAHGIPMDSGCRAGNCGSCITAIRSGDVEYLNEPGATVESGSCLTCISVPKGKLSLDA